MVSNYGLMGSHLDALTKRDSTPTLAQGIILTLCFLALWLASEWVMQWVEREHVARRTQAVQTSKAQSWDKLLGCIDTNTEDTVYYFVIDDELHMVCKGSRM